MPQGITISKNYLGQFFDLADTGNNRILKCQVYPNQTAAYCSIVSITTTQATSVMAPSPLFVTDTGNNRVLSKLGGEFLSIATGVSSPQGLAADHVGNRYMADTGNNRILKIATTPTPAPSANIGNVPVGRVSTVSLTFAFPAISGDVFNATQLNNPVVGTFFFFGAGAP